MPSPPLEEPVATSSEKLSVSSQSPFSVSKDAEHEDFKPETQAEKTMSEANKPFTPQKEKVYVTRRKIDRARGRRNQEFKKDVSQRSRRARVTINQNGFRKQHMINSTTGRKN